MKTFFFFSFSFFSFILFFFTKANWKWPKSRQFFWIFGQTSEILSNHSENVGRQVRRRYTTSRANLFLPPPSPNIFFVSYGYRFPQINNALAFCSLAFVSFAFGLKGQSRLFCAFCPQHQCELKVCSKMNEGNKAGAFHTGAGRKKERNVSNCCAPRFAQLKKSVAQL